MKKMDDDKVSLYTFLGSGLISLLCIPAIFLAENYKIHEGPIHVTQLFFLVLCFLSCIIYLRETKKRHFSWKKALAIIGTAIIGALFSFAAVIICLHLFSPGD
jgi:uncharacterized membrane protein YfcA